MWIHKGCHSYFNDKWDIDIEGNYGFDPADKARLITRDDQKRLTKGYITAIAGAVIRYEAPTLAGLQIVFGDPGSAPWNPVGVVATCQYQNQDRLLLQHFEEGDPPVISAPTMGASVTIGADLTTKVEQFDDGMAGTGILYQDTQGLRVEWSMPRAAERSYVITLPAGSVSMGILISRYGLECPPSPRIRRTSRSRPKGTISLSRTERIRRASRTAAFMTSSARAGQTTSFSLRPQLLRPCGDS